MANPSKDKSQGSTSSGHGALGMGGQPDDNPRDQAGGHEDLVNDDRSRPVEGAHRSTQHPTRSSTTSAANDPPVDKRE